ncbi:branched-chain amino acid ABC transporter permease [Rhodovulum sp. DZ06]|uniref:branched-chain amino acid ABC transporter permease n=1 Tax=Rhodovulum sp. DZ06 TaxID=3425126 RepID=UPI003D3574CE
MSDMTSTSLPALPGARLAPRLKAAAAIFAVLAALPPVFAAMGEPYLTSIATRMMVYAIAALSLDLILGYGALVSFGHAAYLGIGAYAVVGLSRNGIDEIWLQMAAGIGASAVFAAITGAISLRTRGIYFIMITLAFGQMAYFFFVSLSAWGGDDGTALAARSTVFGQDWLGDDLSLFYLVLALLALCFALLHAITRSRFGRVLVGARENETRMQAIGFTPFPYQLAAYVISGCICSVAGVLLANSTEYVSPDFMTWHRSGELIVMLILGGIGTLTGALVGALMTIGLEEGLARAWDHWRLIFGFLLLMVVLYSPGGLSALADKLGLGARK